MFRNIADLRVFNFTLVCPRMPNCMYRVQEFVVPEMTIEPIRVPSPIPTSPTFIPGDNMQSPDRFRVQILADESMDAYFDIYDWMVSIRDQEHMSEHMFSNNPNLYSDLSLIIRGNNQQIVATNKFYEVFPVRLDQLTLKTSSDRDEVVIFGAEFCFSRQIMERTSTEIPPKQEV